MTEDSLDDGRARPDRPSDHSCRVRRVGRWRRGPGVRLGPPDDEDSIAAIHHALDLVRQDPLPARPAGQQVGADEGVNASPFGPKDRHDPERACVLRPCAGACLAAWGAAACGGRLLSLDPRHPGRGAP